jgi:negative regulator of genetic competence, sporulation and motility
MQMVQKVNNRIAQMDMDIIVSTAPDTANLQQEVFAELMGIVEKVGLQAVFSPEFALILEMTPLQNKAEILEKIKQAQGGDDPRLAKMQQMIEQLQQALQEAVQGKEAAETKEKLASAGLKEAQKDKTEVETMVLSFEAGQNSAPEPVERDAD